MKSLIVVLALFGLQSAFGAAGFGQRKAPAKAAPAVQKEEEDDIKWVSVSYENAENEVLRLLYRDVSQIEDIASSLAIYNVKVIGNLPARHDRTLRSKIEQIFLNSKIQLRECQACEASRLIRNKDGTFRYITSDSDPKRMSAIAKDIGVSHLLLAELDYDPEELKIRVRVLNGTNQAILWSREYSSAQVLSKNESGKPGSSSDGSSLSQVLLGEIVFTTIISPGFTLLPTINSGSGSQLLGYPGIDVVIGERFDGGYKTFGLKLGVAANMGVEPQVGKPLPFAVQIGPRLAYTFNPNNTSSARYSMAFEIGGLVSTGIVAPYVSLGPQIAMIKRFSIGVMPIYILDSEAKGAETIIQQDDGSFDSEGTSDAGSFGGLGFAFRANIHW